MAARNILIVMADQLNPFAVGCYGSQAARTPHIDRLANGGIRFDAAYSNNPLCTPARYAFMRGDDVGTLLLPHGSPGLKECSCLWLF